VNTCRAALSWANHLPALGHLRWNAPTPQVECEHTFDTIAGLPPATDEILRIVRLNASQEDASGSSAGSLSA
jgi:hypothetical protein